MKLISCLFFFLVATLPIVNAQQPQAKITIAVAANMQYAVEELKANFERQTGCLVEIITGSSGKLTAQIMEGAPFDVFISADMKYPETLFTKGFATAPPRVYAQGTIVLFTTNASIPLSPGLAVLTDSRIKKIAIANPSTAPYGGAAMEALKYYRLDEKVKVKLVLGESIAQATQFIATGAADIGIIAKSVVLSREMAGKGKWTDIDTAAYHPITQGAVLLKHGNTAMASKFFFYLYSGSAKVIFRKYGYIVNNS